jgi:hypothetical protein
MSITFNVNQKALQSLGKQKLTTSSVHAAFNSRTNSNVEAVGGTHTHVVGNYIEPSAADYINDIDDVAFKNKMIQRAPRVSAFSHALLEAVHFSFSDHYPLALSPDHIWLTIAQGFAHHVNANAEQLRKLFVAHEGKKMIMIDRDDFVKGSATNDWQGCFSQFSDQIAEHIGKKRDLVVSNFTTTDAVSKAASEIVLMDSMKSYFKYAVRTLCGIPTITLLGEVSDWKSLRTRAENLAEFDLDWWVKPLTQTLDHFVKAAEGNPDLKFWDNMYKQSGGSGGPYATGWINTLFPYVEDYQGNKVKNQYAEKWDKGGFSGGPTLDEYPNNLSKLPFKWQYYDTTHDMELLGGLVGVHQNPDTLEVQPSIGWAVRDQGTSKEGPIDPKEDW